MNNPKKLYKNFTIFYLVMEINKKYITANIIIPIEVINDDDYNPLTDCMSIHFEKINEIPESTNIDIDQEFIKEQIKKLFLENIIEPQQEIIESIPIITHDELKKRIKHIHKRYLTFKNKGIIKNRYTAKNYSDEKTYEANFDNIYG
jgi:hypothetical protein